jgi:hypothetical protein
MVDAGFRGVVGFSVPSQRGSGKAGAGVMGNVLGNLLGLAVIVVVATISIFSLSVGVVAYAIVAYASWAVTSSK